MKVEEAIKIVSALADGVDPYTGEVFPQNSPYQNPDIIRALFAAIKGLETLEAKAKRNENPLTIRVNLGQQKRMRN